MTKGARVSISSARFGLQHLGTLAVEIGPYPGMLGLKQFAHRSDGDDLAVRQRRDAVADGIQAGEVMGDHEHRQPQCFLQCLDQDIEFARRNGIQTRGRLVEKHDRGIERERAGQRHAFGHAARQFGRKLVAILRYQPDHFELGGSDFVHQFGRHHQIFAQWKLDVLSNREGRKQRSLLEQNAPSPRSTLGAAIIGVADRSAHHLDCPALPWNEPDDGSHQDRLAAAGSADQTEDLAPSDIQRQLVDHDMPAEADHKVMYANSERPGCFLHRYIPIDAKKTANNPSSTITRKIDFTTEVVVCLPSDSALPFTRSPSLQATTPITSAINGALMIPTSKWVTDTASCSRAMKMTGPMPP